MSDIERKKTSQGNLNDDQLVSHIVDSSKLAFQEMFEMSLKGKSDKNRLFQLEPDIVTFIKLSKDDGEVTFSFEFKESTLTNLINRSLEINHSRFSVTSLDLAGELTNCIGGLLKSHLNQSGFHYEMNLPMTVHRPFMMVCPIKEILPGAMLETEFGSFFIRAWFSKKVH